MNLFNLNIENLGKRYSPIVGISSSIDTWIVGFEWELSHMGSICKWVVFNCTKLLKE